MDAKSFWDGRDLSHVWPMRVCVCAGKHRTGHQKATQTHTKRKAVISEGHYEITPSLDLRVCVCVCMSQ